MQFETEIGRIEMAKSFGSVVLLVRGPHTVNALVVQSVPQEDGEHLTVVYLDPDKASPLLSGQSVDSAIKREFAVPLTEGKTFGWKDLPAPVLPTGGVPSEDTGEQTAHEISPNLKAAAAIIEQQSTLIKAHRQKIADLEAELEGVKTELATTTEGIDKQLQGIADATAAKEAAPEATTDPTSSEAVPSTDPASPSPSPDSALSDSSQDSATSEQ